MFPWKDPAVSHPGFVDMTGRVLGCLTVVERAANTRHGTACWLCRCNLCGEQTVEQGCVIRAKLPQRCRNCRKTHA